MNQPPAQTISEAIGAALENHTADSARAIGVWSIRAGAKHWAIELRDTLTGQRKRIAIVPAHKATEATAEALAAITTERRRLAEQQAEKRGPQMDRGHAARAHAEHA